MCQGMNTCRSTHANTFARVYGTSSSVQIKLLCDRRVHFEWLSILCPSFRVFNGYENQHDGFKISFENDEKKEIYIHRNKNEIRLNFKSLDNCYFIWKSFIVYLFVCFFLLSSKKPTVCPHNANAQRTQR